MAAERVSRSTRDDAHAAPEAVGRAPQLILRFNPAPYLKPDYLCAHDRLPAESPLRNPEAYWTREAARLLDGRSQQLGAGSEQSFREKCARFFQAARHDLETLRARGVSPNFIAASVLLLAWNWRLPERDPARLLLTQGPAKWRRRWQALDRAAAILRELRPIGEQVDGLIEAEWHRIKAQEARRARTQPRRRRPVDWNEVDWSNVATEDEDSLLGGYQRYIWDEEGSLRPEPWRGPDLRGRVQRTAAALPDAADELREAVRYLQHRGRVPEDKLNRLVALLACVFAARRVGSRYVRLARLLDAAALPRVPPGYFARDPQKVRQRFMAFTKQHPEVVRDIEKAVAAALKAARG